MAEAAGVEHLMDRQAGRLAAAARETAVLGVEAVVAVARVEGAVG